MQGFCYYSWWLFLLPTPLPFHTSRSKVHKESSHSSTNTESLTTDSFTFSSKFQLIHCFLIRIMLCEEVLRGKFDFSKQYQKLVCLTYLDICPFSEHLVTELLRCVLFSYFSCRFIISNSDKNILRRHTISVYWSLNIYTVLSRVHNTFVFGDHHLKLYNLLNNSKVVTFH